MHIKNYSNFVHFFFFLYNFEKIKKSHSSISSSVSDSISCLVSGTSNNTFVSSGSRTDFELSTESFNLF